MNIKAIHEYLGENWAAVNESIHSALRSDIKLLNTTNESILSNSGKQLRPLLALLLARMCSGGQVSESTVRYAAASELLHNATLLHDDVADDSSQRRGVPTIMSLMGPTVSVLVGDYLLSKSMQFIAETGMPELYNQLALLGNILTRGELLQLQHSYSIPTEEDYIEIIKKKTAVLFTISAESAAISVGATVEQREALRQFAEYLGICFQIKDDIFDYTPNAQIGKPTLNDIREGKFTLPLIHALESIHANEASLILDAVKKRQFTEDFFYNIGSLVARTGGIEYAEKQMEQYRQKAVDALSIFADSEIKEALLNLLEFTIQRKK